jgi:hypothetical protein
MKFNLKRIASFALIAALIAAAPAAATLTYDSETTNTTTTSDLTGGETVTDLDNSTVYKRIEVQSDNATTSGLANPEEAFTLKMSVNDSDNGEDGRTFYTNSSTFAVEDATNGHYSINVSHAEMFDELERDVDENVTVDVTVVFNETESDEEAATIAIHAQNGNERTVEVVSDSDVENESGVELTNESRTLRSDLDFVTVESDEPIDQNTTVSFVFANDTVEDKYTAAYDASSFSSGDYVHSMTAYAEDRPIMVFANSGGDERDAGYFAGGFDPSEDTYATYYNNGGDHGENAQLDVIPQGDDADSSSLEIKTSGNKKLGFVENLKNFGFDAARSAGIGIGVEA